MLKKLISLSNGAKILSEKMIIVLTNIKDAYSMEYTEQDMQEFSIHIMQIPHIMNNTNLNKLVVEIFGEDFAARLLFQSYLLNHDDNQAEKVVLFLQNYIHSKEYPVLDTTINNLLESTV